MTSQKLIALDADGVLVDYNTAYGAVWDKAFNTKLTVADPLAYHARDRWALPTLKGEELEYFRTFFDEEFWSTMPALEGAVLACEQLQIAGYSLVCVSALPSEFERARLTNLKNLGFPIDRVLATPSQGLERSPKSNAIRTLSPVAFVDDHLPYLHAMPVAVHKALIMREPNGSPNHSEEDAHLADSRHTDLLSFSNWWLGDSRQIA